MTHLQVYFTGLFFVAVVKEWYPLPQLLNKIISEWFHQMKLRDIHLNCKIGFDLKDVSVSNRIVQLNRSTFKCTILFIGPHLLKTSYSKWVNTFLDTWDMIQDRDVMIFKIPLGSSSWSDYDSIRHGMAVAFVIFINMQHVKALQSPHYPS